MRFFISRSYCLPAIVMKILTILLMRRPVMMMVLLLVMVLMIPVMVGGAPAEKECDDPETCPLQFALNHR